MRITGKPTLGAYEWVSPLINTAGKVIDGVWKADPPPPPQPVKPEIPWTPIIAGGLGLVVIGAALIGKKKKK